MNIVDLDFQTPMSFQTERMIKGGAPVVLVSINPTDGETEGFGGAVVDIGDETSGNVFQFSLTQTRVTITDPAEVSDDVFSFDLIDLLFG
ncbi:MAG: hypothetical protein AAGF93_07130 [Cyanobacteria bacterium P01_H01_bin.105]